MKWNGGFVVNKAKVYCVASAVAVCVASNPNMDVLAKQVQPVKLEEKAQQTITAEDFIKQYLSTKEIVKDSTNKDVEKSAFLTKEAAAAFKADCAFSMSSTVLAPFSNTCLASFKLVSYAV